MLSFWIWIQLFKILLTPPSHQLPQCPQSTWEHPERTSSPSEDPCKSQTVTSDENWFFSSNWINMPGVFDVEQLWPVLPPLEIPNAWNSPPAFKCKKWSIFIVDWMITAPHFNIRWRNWYEEWLIWMNATNTSKKDIEDLTRHLHCHR